MLPRRKAAKSHVPAFVDLRSHLFSTDPTTLDLDRAAPVWGGIMDMTTPGGSATLAVVADGTVSLYTSTGGGLIGAGADQAVATVAAQFLDRVAADLERLEPADDVPLPPVGAVRLSGLTWASPRFATAVAPQDALRRGGHPLTELYAAAHDVITQMRLLEEEGATSPR